MLTVNEILIDYTHGPPAVITLYGTFDKYDRPLLYEVVRLAIPDKLFRLKVIIKQIDDNIGEVKGRWIGQDLTSFKAGDSHGS